MPPKDKKLMSSTLSASDATLIRIGQVLTGMVLLDDGKTEMDETFARKLKQHEGKDNYARKVRSLNKEQLFKYLLTLHIIASYEFETKKADIGLYFNSNKEPFRQDPYLREYKKRGEEYIKKMLYEYDGIHTLHRIYNTQFKGKSADDERLKATLKDLLNSKGQANDEKIDENDGDFKNFVKEWVQDFEPLEEAVKREQELFDPDLFEAIKKDTKLRETGRTDKYDIHVQDAIYKPLRGYRRNAIHSVKQIVDMDLFNRIRI